jgi:hypothetical protein
MPKTLFTSAAIALVLATSAATANAGTTHRYTSTLQEVVQSTANGYPEVGGTSVSSGTWTSPFGTAPFVDYITISGHPSPAVFTFTGIEVDFLANGMLLSTFSGWAMVRDDGSISVADTGHFTGGTDAYRAARGTYRFTGTTPPGSNTTTGRETGTLIH